MDLFARMAAYGYGSVHAHRDPAVGLRAIVAVHDTRLGPALGGCRFIPYDDESSAFTDALRLARAMTYKAALAGLALGGGKSVILYPSQPFDRAALFRSFGRFVDSLGGRYITAEDSGTTPEDMEVLRGETRWVTGVAPENGGSGDPSPFTALGVRRGIEACVAFKLGRGSLDGVHVAVQGVGHVGWKLCEELHREGARLTVADVDPPKAERARAAFNARVVPIADIFAVEADVLAPCALGSAINEHTVSRVAAPIVAGAANNQLSDPRHADTLRRRGVLYAPDYAVNAGGLINVAQEVAGYDPEAARARTLGVYDTVAEIARRADAEGVPTTVVADRMVEERLAAAVK